jgi:hypothetical protein
MKAMRRLWKGELPLAQAFWNWAVVGGIAVNVLTSILFLALIMGDRIVAAFVVSCALFSNLQYRSNGWRLAIGCALRGRLPLGRPCTLCHGCRNDPVKCP